MEQNEKQKKQDELVCKIMESQLNLYRFVLENIPVGGHRKVVVCGRVACRVCFGDHYVTIKVVRRESENSLMCLMSDLGEESWMSIHSFSRDSMDYILGNVEL